MFCGLLFMPGTTVDYDCSLQVPGGWEQLAAGGWSCAHSYVGVQQVHCWEIESLSTFTASVEW